MKETIKNIEVGYDYEETYIKLYNACIDYMNDTQTGNFEYLFDDIVSYELAEERARWELENGGLVRLYYFLGNANCNNDIFRIDGYGNLQDIQKDDLECLKNDILSQIEDLEKGEK